MYISTANILISSSILIICLLSLSESQKSNNDNQFVGRAGKLIFCAHHYSFKLKHLQDSISNGLFIIDQEFYYFFLLFRRITTQKYETVFENI